MITIKCCLVGALLGIGLTFVAAAILKISDPAFKISEPAFGPFAVLGGLLGIAVGQHKAFQYRLQAQLTLCQMQTEFNTRQRPEKPGAA